jgi:methyl-accepting chemotaxis protein
MEKKSQINRRRNYFIEKRFQRNFILKFCVLVMAGSFLSGVIIYLMSRSTVTTTFENCRLTIKSTWDFMLPAVLISSAVVIVFIGLATIAVTLFTSHRIAGPLYRMEKDIDEVASGNLKKVFRLRQGDELKALAENLDKMTRAIGDMVSGIKRSVSEIESNLETADKKILGNKLKELKAALSNFIV